MVAATVVAPSSRCAMARGKSRREHLRAFALWARGGQLLKGQAHGYFTAQYSNRCRDRVLFAHSIFNTGRKFRYFRVGENRG